MTFGIHRPNPSLFEGPEYHSDQDRQGAGASLILPSQSTRNALRTRSNADDRFPPMGQSENLLLLRRLPRQMHRHPGTGRRFHTGPTWAGHRDATQSRSTNHLALPRQQGGTPLSLTDR